MSTLLGDDGNNMHGDDDFDPFGLKNDIEYLAQNQLGQSILDSNTQPESLADPSSDNVGAAALVEPPLVSRVTRSNLTTSSHKATTIALPPKLTVKLALHEEVSSCAIPFKEGSSDVSVEGTISAQVQCSDAKRNAPFGLEPADLQNESFMFCPNADFGTDEINPSNSSTNYIHIPKHEIGFVKLGSYSLQTTVQHMPILLERRVTVKGTSCRVAIQVRSKLTNKGDLSDFTVAVAVPEYVDVNSVEIQRGDGVWDELKRTIKWSRAYLKRGESFMISAKTELLDEIENVDELQFPVLLRCSSSSDHLSNADFKVLKAEGHPSSITVHKSYSFLLLHRLP